MLVSPIVEGPTPPQSPTSDSSHSGLPYLASSPPPAPLKNFSHPMSTVQTLPIPDTGRLTPVPKLSHPPVRGSSHPSPRASTSTGPPSFTTSNSSLPRQPGTASTGGSRESGGEYDPTAALIQKLYARLDEQGVSGDGWDEGLERSRDGIINREELAEGVRTLDRKNSVLDRQLDKQDYVLKRVDR